VRSIGSTGNVTAIVSVFMSEHPFAQSVKSKMGVREGDSFCYAQVKGRGEGVATTACNRAPIGAYGCWVREGDQSMQRKRSLALRCNQEAKSRANRKEAVGVNSGLMFTRSDETLAFVIRCVNPFAH
jgi:hypothetical protein